MIQDGDFALWLAFVIVANLMIAGVYSVMAVEWLRKKHNREIVRPFFGYLFKYSKGGMNIGAFLSLLVNAWFAFLTLLFFLNDFLQS